MTQAILTLNVVTEFDVIAARQRARQIAGACGFGSVDQARIGTVVSELARNIFNYAGAGSVSFSAEGAVAPQQLSITFSDCGRGLPMSGIFCPAVTGRPRAWAWASCRRAG